MECDKGPHADNPIKFFGTLSLVIKRLDIEKWWTSRDSSTRPPSNGKSKHVSVDTRSYTYYLKSEVRVEGIDTEEEWTLLNLYSHFHNEWWNTGINRDGFTRPTILR